MAATSGSGAFPTTRWTLILSARESPEAKRQALRSLLETYWQPLYVFLRRKGLSPDAAQDAVQDLSVQLLDRDAVERLSPEKGRLRAYLRATAANYLANQHEREQAQRHGRGVRLIPLDLELAERLVAEETEDPDRAFDRRWAAGVMQRALQRLEQEHRSEQRAGPFELIRLFFGGGAPPSYREAALAHGMSVPQLKSFLHRARQRFAELVREEVGDTVERREDTDAELQHVVTTWGA